MNSCPTLVQHVRWFDLPCGHPSDWHTFPSRSLTTLSASSLQRSTGQIFIPMSLDFAFLGPVAQRFPQRRTKGRGRAQVEAARASLSMSCSCATTTSSRPSTLSNSPRRPFRRLWSAMKITARLNRHCSNCTPVTWQVPSHVIMPSSLFIHTFFHVYGASAPVHWFRG